MRLFPLQWRNDERDGVSNLQPRNCLLNRFFRRRSKKISKLRATGLCEGNSPVTSEFPVQRVSDAENVSNWWRHHAPFNPLLLLSHIGSFVLSFLSSVNVSASISARRVSRWATPAGSCTVWNTVSTRTVRTCRNPVATTERTDRSPRSSVRRPPANTSQGQYLWT